VRAAQQIGYPVVVKVASPDITHKTDVGGVILDVTDDRAAIAAFERIVRSVQTASPGARLDGVTVQPMARATDGIELIVGAKRDPVFGTVILAGLGGVAAEVFGDHALGFPPLNERLARRMLESLRCWPLLRGYRGRPAVRVDLLVEVLMRLSYLVADYPELLELDINPLLVTPDRVVGLDARAVVDRSAQQRTRNTMRTWRCVPTPRSTSGRASSATGPPWCCVRSTRRRTNVARTSRRCSPRDDYARFRYMFSWSSPDAARRYCFIDYEPRGGDRRRGERRG